MKEVGKLFEETRESIGLSEKEVANDLEITEAQLENLENGSVNAFKDVFFLKDLVMKYAKYLNLNEDEILREYNDFMFDFTSKIPVNEIENKVRELERTEKEKEEKTISSPYTAPRIKKNQLKSYLLIGICVLIIILFIILVVVLIKEIV
jgi:cytoskeletal protein RodZ